MGSGWVSRHFAIPFYSLICPARCFDTVEARDDGTTGAARLQVSSSGDRQKKEHQFACLQGEGQQQIIAPAGIPSIGKVGHND